MFGTLFDHKQMNHLLALMKALANFAVLTVSPTVQNLGLSEKRHWPLSGWTLLQPFGSLLKA